MRLLEFGSAEYETALALRRRVLRDPLGIFWTEEEKAMEPEEQQYAVFDGEEVVACVSVRQLNDYRVKIRQMAVAPERQGKGIGRMTMRMIEAILYMNGVVEMELHAREEAVGFYERLAFRPVGERFEEVGIPHQKMIKQITEGGMGEMMEAG